MVKVVIKYQRNGIYNRVYPYALTTGLRGGVAATPYASPQVHLYENKRLSSSVRNYRTHQR